jgi:catechol 2,3-dioxygenase-like lactoylglutathione lyase family enzyme
MQKLAHTGLTVRDLDRSVALYRDVIGMKVVCEQEKQGGSATEMHRCAWRSSSSSRVHGIVIELFQTRSEER